VKRKFSRLLIFCAIIFGVWVWWSYDREHRYDNEILKAAQRHQIAPELVRAVVWQESRFNARSRGKVGEIGLMQIRKLTGEEWATAERVNSFEPDDLFSPETNTRVGAWYLAKLLKRYARTDNPLPYALADYNAGRSNVLKWNKGAAATNSAVFIEQIGFPSTRKYVESVMRKYDSLKH
jgi:soluble lytic murein transglycosylase